MRRRKMRMQRKRRREKSDDDKRLKMILNKIKISRLKKRLS